MNTFSSNLPSSGPCGSKASVLLITLCFVLLITVITVAFLVRSRSSLQTSQSYSKEFVAGEIGDIAIDKLAAEFQTEIKTASSHSPPLDILLPPRIGVSESNPRNSALVRRTTGDTAAYNNAYLTAGFPAVPHSNRASTVSTETVAKNGWSFDKQRWLTPGLLRTNETFTPPDWVYVYGNSKANTGSATDKESDIVGRFAAMVYDVGGLLDINETGVPSTIPLGDKGSAAFADLSAVFPSAADADKLTQWRNGATATAKDFYGDPSATDPADAGSISSPVSKLGSGKNRFFSRMEFVEAAKAGKLGLSEALLPSFRTRSESANHVAMGSYFANGTSAPVRLDNSSLAAAKDTTFTINRIDGSTETCTIKKGKPLVWNRFPLARLRWLADCNSDGSPKHSAEIKKYFGLTWDSGNNIFIYTSPDSTAAAGSIKTLTQLVAGINGGSISPREPDFFEWLKSAVNPDSLGQSGGTTDRMLASLSTDRFGNAAPAGVNVAWEASKDLHILRIGANIIDQSDPDSIPTGIRSQFTNVDPTPFDSYGQENLPYINEVITSALRDGNTLNGYMQFELWNPNRNASTGDTNTGNATHFPRDFLGNKISNYRVRIVRGRALMEPMVFISPPKNDSNNRNDLVSKRNGEKENINVVWASLKETVAYSQRKLKAADFISPDLAGNAVFFTLGANGTFFSEPCLVNGGLSGTNSMDTTNTVSMTVTVNPAPALNGIFGASPNLGTNALLLCTVTGAPDFSNVKGTGLWTSKEYDDYLAYDNWLKGGKIPSNLYGPAAPPAQKVIPEKPPWWSWFDKASGNKEWNAVQFYSDGGIYNGVATDPITLALDVYDGNAWHTCQIYNNLDLGGRGAGGNGPQSVVYSNDPDTRNSNATYGHPNSDWTSSSNTTDRCFFKWTEWEIHKGYPNTDPRTERFGLTDQMFSSPGLGIRTHTDPWSGSGSTWNLANGLNTSLGTDFSARPTVANPFPTYSNEGPAKGWAIVDCGATKVSLPADLALNVGAITGVAGAYHSYSDADGVVRPADARWVPANAHPALPLTNPDGTPTPYAGAKDARPVILDRPFRSVAELGMVFRDIPWKSLDLFSPDSPDRRLLDVFSIEDRATLTGKINPNLATKATLLALLNKTSLNPSDPDSTDIVSTGDTGSVADAILAATAPISSGENLSSLLSGTTTGSAPRFNLRFKTKTENFLRALSSTTDTGSWQLMLDVVAQSGRIATENTDLKNFIVEGQRRFFVYLTLDRITGEVVDRHIESIYE